MSLKRVIRLLVTTSVLVAMFAGAEFIRGASVAAALGFGLTWGSIGGALLLATSLYYSSRGIRCAVCASEPEGRGSER